eukprot:gene12653-16963_t
MEDSIARLNHMCDKDNLTRCCGSNQWVSEMLLMKPFSSIENIIELSDQIWWSLPLAEWMMAFAAHPKIGDKSALKKKFSEPHSWEGEEQSGANSAADTVLEKLSQLNEDYELRHGFIFLICATGKTAEEMLSAIELRIDNDTADEIKIAAGEQSKIVQLRLIKLSDSISPSNFINNAKL